jgi:hypothetical protein
MGFVVDKVALGQVFPRVLRLFPCQFQSTRQKIIIIIFIFTTNQATKSMEQSPPEKLTGPQPVKKFHVMKPEGSLPHSQEPTRWMTWEEISVPTQGAHALKFTNRITWFSRGSSHCPDITVKVVPLHGLKEMWGE